MLYMLLRHKYSKKKQSEDTTTIDRYALSITIFDLSQNARKLDETMRAAVRAYACVSNKHSVLARLADVDVDDQLKTQQPCSSAGSSSRRWRILHTSFRLVSPRLAFVFVCSVRARRRLAWPFAERQSRWHERRIVVANCRSGFSKRMASTMC